LNVLVGRRLPAASREVGRRLPAASREESLGQMYNSLDIFGLRPSLSHPSPHSESIKIQI